MTLLAQVPHQSPLPPDTLAHLHQEMEPGEALVWTGHSSPLRILRRTGFSFYGGILFVLFGACCLYVLVNARIGTAGASYGGWLATVVIMIFGFCAGFSVTREAIRTFRSETKTVYALSNRRVLVLPPGSSARTLSPQQARARQLKVGFLGGDIYFADFDKTVTDPEGNYGIERDGFLGIHDAPAVDALLRQTFG